MILMHVRNPFQRGSLERGNPKNSTQRCFLIRYLQPCPSSNLDSGARLWLKCDDDREYSGREQATDGYLKPKSDLNNCRGDCYITLKCPSEVFQA